MNILRRTKKALYFTTEAVIAMMILSVGFGIIFYMFTVLSKPPVGIVQTTLYDTVDLFDMKIKDIGNGSCSSNSSLVTNGNITDTTQSLLIQAGELYYRYKEKNCDYCDELLKQCINDFIQDQDKEDENLRIEINGETWYKNGTITRENATVIFPQKIFLIGTLNNTAMWGPYIAQIEVWK